MSEYTDHLLELLDSFGHVTMRRMFGGHGVFRDGVMFALVADDTLYLKSDSQSEALYRAHGLEQFAYQKGEKTVLMSYFMAPDEVLDDPQALHDWVAVAFEAALRARR